VFDIGHFESEQYTKEIFRDLLHSYDVEAILAEEDKNIVQTY
jgi:hypothetical protein